MTKGKYNLVQFKITIEIDTDFKDLMYSLRFDVLTEVWSVDFLQR